MKTYYALHENNMYLILMKQKQKNLLVHDSIMVSTIHFYSWGQFIFISVLLLLDSYAVTLFVALNLFVIITIYWNNKSAAD